MVSRSVLADVGLGVLAVVTVAAAGIVLLRDPTPPTVDLPPQPVARASATAAPAAAVLPTAEAAAVDAVLLRSRTTPGGHVVVAGRELGWNLGNAPLDAVASAVAGQDLVLVQSGQTDQEQVLETLEQVRDGAPGARLVVLAPLVPVTGGQGPAELARAGKAVGAEVLDPAALGWLQDVPDAFQSNGSLTPEGAQRVGERLAEALED